MRRTLAAAGISLIFSHAISAQANASTPAFEVASLKPVQITGDLYTANLGRAIHGEVTLTNATLADCIRFAYNITNDAQIAGPDWIRSKEVRFDIVAKAPADTPVDRLKLMLQALLAERFRLLTHREPRELPFLALTVAKNGPKLATAKDGPDTNSGPQVPGRIVSSQMSMLKLTTLLSRFLRQTVIDQTGLSGAYDVNLVWTPEDYRPLLNGVERTDVVPGPTIFTAVQEQLGLKLQSRKAPVEVLVVDQAEKTPVEN